MTNVGQIRILRVSKAAAAWAWLGFALTPYLPVQAVRLNVQFLQSLVFKVHWLTAFCGRCAT